MHMTLRHCSRSRYGAGCYGAPFLPRTTLGPARYVIFRIGSAGHRQDHQWFGLGVVHPQNEEQLLQQGPTTGADNSATLIPMMSVNPPSVVFLLRCDSKQYPIPTTQHDPFLAKLFTRKRNTQ